MDSALDDPELNDRQGQDEREEDDGFGAREAELKVLERVEVDAVDERARSVHRTAAGEQVDLGECLQDGDGVDDEQEEQRRRNHWDRDPREHPHPTGSVEARRLVDLFGNALKAGEQNDDVRAKREPNRRDRDGDDRDGRLDEPLRTANADQREDVIE